MINEAKIIFDKIKGFRYLLKEGVGDAPIIDAIENQEFIYLYYNGDENVEKGYRTVRPMTLGRTSKGHTVLRAWQDNGASWHFANRATRPDSERHDFWNDEDGQKPGWRMFRVDKISQIYPTGVKFNDERGGPLIPAGYHEGGDDDMSTVLAYVSTKDEPDVDYKFDREREITGDVKTDKERTEAKWNSIKRGNGYAHKISAEDVIKLRDLASRVVKKKHSNFLVAVDERGGYHLITPKQKEAHQVPESAILGSLPHLYDSVVNANKTPDSTFFRNKLSQTQQGLNEELPTIPHNKATFFKQ